MCRQTRQLGQWLVFRRLLGEMDLQPAVPKTVCAFSPPGGWCQSSDQRSQPRCSLLRFCDNVHSGRNYQMHCSLPQDGAARQNNLGRKSKWGLPPSSRPQTGGKIIRRFFFLTIQYTLRQRMNLPQGSFWIKRTARGRPKRHLPISKFCNLLFFFS